MMGSPPKIVLMRLRLLLGNIVSIPTNTLCELSNRPMYTTSSYKDREYHSSAIGFQKQSRGVTERMETQRLAAAAWEEQDAGSGPVPNSPMLGPMTGAIHNISARHLHDIATSVPDDRQFLRAWRRSLHGDYPRLQEADAPGSHYWQSFSGCSYHFRRVAWIRWIGRCGVRPALPHHAQQTLQQEWCAHQRHRKLLELHEAKARKVQWREGEFPSAPERMRMAMEQRNEDTRTRTC